MPVAGDASLVLREPLPDDREAAVEHGRDIPFSS